MWNESKLKQKREWELKCVFRVHFSLFNNHGRTRLTFWTLIGQKQNSNNRLIGRKRETVQFVAQFEFQILQQIIIIIQYLNGWCDNPCNVYTHRVVHAIVTFYFTNDICNMRPMHLEINLKNVVKLKSTPQNGTIDVLLYFVCIFYSVICCEHMFRWSNTHHSHSQAHAFTLFESQTSTQSRKKDSSKQQQ